MNFRAGFFRLWILVSLLWGGSVLAVEWHNLGDYWRAASYRAPTPEEIQANETEMGDCRALMVPGTIEKGDAPWKEWWKCDAIVAVPRDRYDWSVFSPMLLVILAPIIGTLLIGSSVAWVAAGFRVRA